MVDIEIGDQVEVLGDWQRIGHPFPIGALVEVIRINDDLCDVCDKSTGDIYWVHRKDLHSYKSNKNKEKMTQMKDALLKVAKRLCKANNTVTTLEIKKELIRDYPYFYWDQQTVSSYMSQYAGDGIFTYTDNGTYRTYSLTTPAQVAATAGPVSKSLATKTVSVPTKGGSKRGRPRKNSTNIGTITVSALPTFIADPGFESVVVDGFKYDRAYIRLAKKSPLGFMSNRKIQKTTAITVNGTTYQVK